MPGFTWKLGDYTGGGTAVKPSYKPWLALDPPEYALGQITVGARSFSDIVVSGLGFTPDVLVFLSYRPKYHNGATDTNFGARGGGMTVGVAGRSPANQFTGSTRIKQGWDMDTGRARWREDRCLNVISHVYSDHTIPLDILSLSVSSWDASGFTLQVNENLYDVSDTISWLALKGDFSVGAFDAPAASLSGFPWAPKGAMFISTKNRPGLDVNSAGNPDPYRYGYWDHMTGFASNNGADPQCCDWGGARPSSWNWTTERWTDDGCILLCRPANGSSFTGTSVLAQARIANWTSDGFNLTWDVSDGEPYRIGYVVTGGQSQAGVIETNWGTRPAAMPDGNYVETRFRPKTILMCNTNYNFDYGTVDPYLYPRSPDAWGFGGNGCLGFHAAIEEFDKFSDLGYDAYSVHTFGNAVAEMGHYSNSGTQMQSRYICAGQGSNSNPPAYHQHSVNIYDSSNLIPSLNWREAHRYVSASRALLNPTDVPHAPGA